VSKVRIDSRFGRHLSADERKELEDLFRKSLILRSAIAKVLTSELNTVILEEESVDLSTLPHPEVKLAADRAERKVLRSVIKMILPEETHE